MASVAYNGLLSPNVVYTFFALRIKFLAITASTESKEREINMFGETTDVTDNPCFWQEDAVLPHIHK